MLNLACACQEGKNGHIQLHEASKNMTQSNAVVIALMVGAIDGALLTAVPLGTAFGLAWPAYYAIGNKERTT